jgi:hypothetical protein
MWDGGPVLGLVEEWGGVDCVEGCFFGSFFFFKISVSPFSESPLYIHTYMHICIYSVGREVEGM